MQYNLLKLLRRGYLQLTSTLGSTLCFIRDNVTTVEIYLVIAHQRVALLIIPNMQWFA